MVEREALKAAAEAGAPLDEAVELAAAITAHIIAKRHGSKRTATQARRCSRNHTNSVARGWTAQRPSVCHTCRMFVSEIQIQIQCKKLRCAVRSSSPPTRSRSAAWPRSST